MGFPVKFVINPYTKIFHWCFISFIKSFSFNFILRFKFILFFGLNKTISVLETFRDILLALGHFVRFFKSILMNLLRCGNLKRIFSKKVFQKEFRDKRKRFQSYLQFSVPKKGFFCGQGWRGTSYLEWHQKQNFWRILWR